MSTKRATRRSSKGTKLYAVRDKGGRFKDVESYRNVKDRFVWRDAASGRFFDVKVADPAVRPRGTSIEKIKKAVKKSGGGSVKEK